jgi:ADP-dependent NAD(P)H-hydrate dehydratase / NAD(P)H-hydrate epimerase
MKILRTTQLRETDNYTIQNEPIASIDLMERAANQLFEWIRDHIQDEASFRVIAGPGNNGGDGLALARLLNESGYELDVWLVNLADSLSENCQRNLDRLKEETSVEVNSLTDKDILPEIMESTIIIDALFGSGLSRPLEGFAVEIVDYINHAKNTVFSIDMPSGLMGEDNSDNDAGAIVKADITLTLELPKLAFFFSDNADYVGDWHIIPIGLHQGFIDEMDSDYNYVTRDVVQPRLMIRSKFDHKGRFGHAFLVAGSYGKIGAAVLAAKACLRGGVGLLTVHIPRLGYEIVQTAIPEAMTSIDKYDKVISKIPSLELFSAVGVGPGIGRSRHAVIAMNELLGKTTIPLVIDADAINIMSENREMLDLIPPDSILTPHPKEFERLVGPSENQFERLRKQIEFAKERRVVVVLKGAHTSVVDQHGFVYFNSTGNPGMAKGGCGDILTGLILALHAQGYSALDASILSVYLHGLSADLAITENSVESLLSTDIINYLGKAFDELKKM